jgi:hypothetical protein
MIKKISLLSITLLLSISIVLISGFLGTTNIKSYDQMRNAQFGFPLPFIKQDLLKSGIDGYEGHFPHRFGIQLDFLDNDPSIDFSRLNFIVSIIIVYGIILIYYLIGRKLYRKYLK